MAHQALGIVKLSWIIDLVFAIIEVRIGLLVVSVVRWSVLGVYWSMHDWLVSRETLRIHRIIDLRITAGWWWMKWRLISLSVFPLICKWTQTFCFQTSWSVDWPWPQIGAVRSIAVCHWGFIFFVLLKGGLILRWSGRSWWLSSPLLLHCEFLCCNWLLPRRDLFRDDQNDRLRNLALRISIVRN